MIEQLQIQLQQLLGGYQPPYWLSVTFVLLLLSLLIDLVVRKGVLHWLRTFVQTNRFSWDDVFWKHKVFQRAARLIPGLIFYYGIDTLLTPNPILQALILKITTIYLVLIGVFSLMALANALTELADSRASSNKLPLRVLQQLFNLLIALAAIVTLLSLLLDQNPMYLLSGLGAFTAIILLIFRDTLLGLVAGVQLAANDMVRRNDWIEMGKYGADGDVTDVGLTTVKVRNWDKTITTIPTYALITDSFKNWRGMEESGGRRIKRSLSLDVNSIQFMDAELTLRLTQVAALKEYLTSKHSELEQQDHDLLEASPINGRRLTNVGTFRAYLLHYLSRHPQIHQSMTLLVRQLETQDKGLPIEIYCFSTEQEWHAYEAIQADIFDHIYAVLPSFGLRAFQSPAGKDFEKLAASVCTEGS